GLYLRDTQSTPAYEAVSDNKYPWRHRFLLENHADHFYGGARVSQTDYRYGGSPRFQWAGPRLRLNPHRERPCGNDRRSPCVPRTTRRDGAASHGAPPPGTHPIWNSARPICGDIVHANHEPSGPAACRQGRRRWWS